jgi:hypothetical protein
MHEKGGDLQILQFRFRIVQCAPCFRHEEWQYCFCSPQDSFGARQARHLYRKAVASRRQPVFLLQDLRFLKFEPYLRNGKPIRAAAILTWDFAFKDRIIVDKWFDPTKEGTTSPIAAAPKRVRVSAGVSQGLLIYQVEPVYPFTMRTAHVQGAVVLAAVIGTDGKIKGLHAISGQKEFVDASIAAVQQWRYRPYILLGNPVEVDTQITVNYTLR